MGRFDPSEADGPGPAGPDRWSVWVIARSWTEIRDRYPLAFADPVAATADTEDEAWGLVVEMLFAAGHTGDTSVRLDLVREDWANRAGRPVKVSGHTVAGISVEQLVGVRADWMQMGTLPLRALLEGLATTPMPRDMTPESRQVALDALGGMREMLAGMAGRRAVIAEPMTRAEYQEGKANRWDRFGDPAPVARPDSDPCKVCFKDATRYSPDGDPFCAAHIPVIVEVDQG